MRMKEMHESVSRQHDLEKSELKKMYDDHNVEKTRQEKELRDEIETLKSELLRSNTNNETLKNTIKECTVAIETFTTSQSELMKQCEAQEKEISEWKQKTRRAIGLRMITLVRFGAAKRRAERDAQVWKQRFDEMQSREDEAEKSILDVETEVELRQDLAHRQISHLESKLEDMSLQIESLRDDLNQRDDKISELNIDLDRNLKLVSKQKKRISDVLEETNERESQIVTLESQIETLNLTIETLKMTIETKSRALNEAEACILDAENSRGETMTLSSQHISDLETKNADLKLEMEVLRHDMSRRQSVVVKNLRSEMESLRAEHNDLQDENVNLNETNCELQDENTNLKETNSKLQDENVNLNERNCELEVENTDLQNRNMDLKVKNSNLVEKNAEIKEKSMNTSEELETTNSRLQKMFEELASQSKTTAELKQQLEKMESLHELEMKENEEETDALMGEVETLRIRLQKQKRTCSRDSFDHTFLE